MFRLRTMFFLFISFLATIFSFVPAYPQDPQIETKLHVLNGNAEALFNAGDTPGAFRLAEEAYQMITKNDPRKITPQSMRARGNIIALYELLGKASETAQAIDEAIATWDRAGGQRDATYYSYKIRLAMADVSIGQFQTASDTIALFDGKSASDFGLPIESDILIGVVKASISLKAGLTEQAGMALDSIEPLLDRIQAKDKSGAAHTISVLRATIYVGNGEFEKAIPLLDKILAATWKSGLPENGISATLKNLLSLSYLFTEKLDEAARLNTEVVDFASRQLTKIDPIAVNAVAIKALILQMRGRFQDAREAFNDALSRAGPNSSSFQGDILGTFASLYSVTGKFSEAEALYRRAFDESQSLNENSPAAFNAAIQLGNFYLSRGRLSEAEPLITEAFAKSLDVLGVKHPLTPEIWRIRAGLSLKKGDLFGARNTIERALQMSIAIKGARDVGTLICMGDLAAVAEADGKYEEAETVLRNIISVQTETGRPGGWNSSTAQNNLGWLLFRAGKFVEAERVLTIAAEGRATALGAEHPLTILSRNNLAVVMAARGKVEDAVKIVTADVSAALKWSEYEIETASNSASRTNAVTSSRDAVALVFALASLKPNREADEAAALVAINTQGSLASRSTELLQIAREDLSPEHRSLFQAYIKAREDLTYTYRTNVYPASQRTSAGSDGSVARRYESAFSQAAGEVARLEAELASRSRSFRGDGSRGILSAADVGSALRDGEVFIQYVIFGSHEFRDAKWSERHVGAVLIQPHRPPLFKDLGAESQILSQISDLTAEFGADDLGALAGLGLYKFLLGPLEEEIGDKKVVYIAPTGSVSSIPFELLTDESGVSLIDKAEVHYTSSARALLQREDPAPLTGQLSIFGGADFDFAEDRPGPGSVRPSQEIMPNSLANEEAAAIGTKLRGSASLRFGYLTATTDEAANVVTMWKSKTGGSADIYLGDRASETNLKAMKSPTVLHLATHGFVTRNRSVPAGEMAALLSGIALRGANLGSSASSQDGVVFGYEIEALDLSETELVVVSACESGAGAWDIFEGSYSLARAFQLAGARATLVARRPVDDRVTADFMADFYQEWLSSKRPPGVALQKVKMSWAKSDKLERNDPRLWGPFFIVEN